MNGKRQIKGAHHSVAELVQNAIATADSQPLDLEKAKKSLETLSLIYGPRNWTDDEIARYARENAILDNLARATGAGGFQGQYGKIDFSSTEKAVADVNAYLDRRNQAHRSRWTASHRHQ